MAEEQNERADKGSDTVSVEQDVQTAFCPNCKQTYWWMYGEDCMPTSLSCGHTMCFRCAKGQWCSQDTEDTTVFCVTCSARVGITTVYKCATSTQNEQTCTSNVTSTPVTSHSNLNDTSAVSDNSAPTHNTPVPHQSSTDMSRNPTGAGQRSSCDNYGGDRLTSALSSPLVLDKIQSQDDARRLLQNDEGFIRDWIVANVPDHVIFKMVGAGNPDVAVSTNVEGNSFVFSYGNTVVISSPTKATCATLTTPEAAGLSNSTPLPSMSAFLGDSASRPSFEQQFLHYLVNKAVQDRSPNSVEESGENSLQAAPDNRDSLTRQEVVAKEDGSGLVSALVTSQPAGSAEAADVGLAKGVGNKGDCGNLSGKDPPQFVISEVLSADGEAPQFSIEPAAILEAQPLLKDVSSEMVADSSAYGSTMPAQSLSGLQELPASALYSTLHEPSISPFVSAHHHPNSTPGFSGATYDPVTHYDRPSQSPHFPPNSYFPRAASSFPYRNYPYSYPNGYPRHELNRPQCAKPWRYGVGNFQKHPRYFPPRGRCGRGRTSSYPRPYRVPAQCSWYSKACNSSLNPKPAFRLSSQPQIRFIQVVRPKSDNQTIPECTVSMKDPPASTKEAPVETTDSESLPVEAQETAEAEVAVMKTRSMPHGTQVEDIYVVPQVWLSDGQNPAPPESPQSECTAYPYSAGMLDGDSSQEGLVTHQNGVLCETQQEVCTKFGGDLPNGMMTQTFEDPDVGLLVDKQNLEHMEMHKPGDGSSLMFETLSGDMQAQKNNTDDSNDYTDFQPVALRTTIPMIKIKPEQSAGAVTQQAASSTSVVIHSKALPTTAPDGWEENVENPVQDMSLIKVEDLQSVGEVAQIRSALKMDSSIPQSDLENVKAGSDNLASCTHIPVTPCESPTSVASVGAHNKTVQFDLHSGSLKEAMVTTQASQVDDVEVIETKSTIPASILILQKDASEHPRNKKKLRRNPSSEFFSSGYEQYSQAWDGSAASRRRRGGKKGKWYPARCTPYESMCSSGQQMGYPYPSHPGYGPPYPYEDYFPFDGVPSMPYAHSTPFQRPPDMPMEMDPCLHLDEETGQLCPDTPYPPFYGAPPAAFGYPLSPSHPYADMLSHHPGSGQEDYSKIVYDPLDKRFHPDRLSKFEHRAEADFRSGSSVRSTFMGSEPRRLAFWASRGESACSEDLMMGAIGHRIRPEDLETVQWLLQQISELNKQVQNDMLGSLEGSLSLLERSAHMNSGRESGGVPCEREVSDMDQLLRCILNLGQVAVNFGWWCRPHYWDQSSERWGEMAMLASSVFEQSIQRLHSVLMFYLDHVFVRKNVSDGGEKAETGDDTSAEESSDVAAVQLNENAACEAQSPFQLSQTGYMLPPPMSDVYAGAVGHSESGVPAFDPSQASSGVCGVSQFLPMAGGLKTSANPSRAVGVPRTCTATTVSQSAACASLFPHPQVNTNSHCQAGNFGPDNLANCPTSSSDSSQLHFVKPRIAGMDTVFDFPVSSVPSRVQPNDSGEGSIDTAQAGAQTSLVCKADGKWTCEGYREYSLLNGMVSQAQSVTVEPVISLQSEPDGQPQASCVSVHSGQDENEVSQSHPCAAQEVDKVYFVGGLAKDSSAEACTDPAGTFYSSEQRIDDNNPPTLYTISHIAEEDHPDFKAAGGTHYIVTTAESMDNAAVLAQDLGEEGRAAGASLVDPHLAQVSNGDSCDVFSETTSGHSVGEETLDCFQNSTKVITVAAEVLNQAEVPVLATTVTETIYHHENDVNLFTVTVSDQNSDSDMVCSGEEVISDAAIMMSETVEVETDRTVKADKTNGLELSTINLKESNADQKENIEPSIGKRKKCKVSLQKTKQMKQDQDGVRQIEKGVQSSRGGKRNLRSSKLCFDLPHHSPKISSKK